MESNQNSPKKQLPPLPENAHQTSQQIPAFYSMQTKQMSNLSLGGSRSTLSMQSMGSSEAIIMPPPDSILQNQTFPVIYKNRAYMVDPNGLINSSFKVKELINSFLKNNFQITELRLQVVYCRS